jgi:MbtH protein
MTDLFIVVRNHEHQYSIWPDGRRIPDGWEPCGVPRPKPDCLHYISEVWTDITPLSARRERAEDREP